mmetsp:Transcript_20766/g.30923  ORF Transcript_20766/g.30923 Transcript_20766/m.30923 type:complete len:85 (-) Transcript_20766:105-359(-)
MQRLTRRPSETQDQDAPASLTNLCHHAAFELSDHGSATPHAIFIIIGLLLCDRLVGTNSLSGASPLWPDNVSIAGYSPSYRPSW